MESVEVVHEGGAEHGSQVVLFSDEDTSDGCRGGRGRGRGPAQRVKGTQQEGEEEGLRPGQEEEGSTQNMVVSYLVLIVRLDSLGSTSHVALPWD